MLMVTGANGNLGRQVIANLEALVGPSGFVAGTRDPSSAFARELTASGVEVRRVDFDDPDTLTAAFERVEAALIVPSAPCARSRTASLTSPLATMKRSPGASPRPYGNFSRPLPRLGAQVERPHALTLLREVARLEFHAVVSVRRASSPIIRSRMTNFWTLPVTVIGNASTKRTYRGTL